MKIVFKNHLILLIIIILLASFLRFWQLDLKPLWIDEILTALFSLGKNYDYIPLNTILTLDKLDQIFSLNKVTNCQEIAKNLINQSTHPPLYFCLSNYWLNINNNLANNSEILIWQLRSLPVIISIINIGAIYHLNKIAFSPEIGLKSAAIMAVSPFAVYLSQEARHYTLPVLLITLSLTYLIKIKNELKTGKIRAKTWLIWGLINGISFYVHYFCFISFVAEIVTILMLINRYKITKYLTIFSYFSVPLIIFIPWFPLLIKHFNSPTTDWLSKPEHINPILQILVSWILMIITLPLENQSLIIQVISGIIMISFMGYILSEIVKNYPPKNSSIFTFSYFIIFVLFQFFIIVYILGKDLTVAPRYNFIYYPAIVSLLAAILPKKTQIILIIVGIISCILAVNNFAFQKPYLPEIVADNFNQSSPPLMIVLGYESSHEIALELSYLMELNRISNNPENILIYFANRKDNYQEMWSNLPLLSLPLNPETIWFFTPHLKQENYPQNVIISNHNCSLDKNSYYQVHFPYFYQKYNCLINNY